MSSNFFCTSASVFCNISANKFLYFPPSAAPLIGGPTGAGAGAGMGGGCFGGGATGTTGGTSTGGAGAGVAGTTGGSCGMVGCLTGGLDSGG